METVTLNAANSSLTVAPEAGGSIVRFWTDHGGSEIDWLRPGDPAALAEGNPGQLACFPLIPYSNRIRDGRFTFQKRLIVLPRAFTREDHAEHGHGWDNPWTVCERAADRLVIEYRHRAAHWPFDYRARQIFELTADALKVTISLVNEASMPMPCGLGLHPYFPRSRSTVLRAEVAGVWLTDGQILPRELVQPLQGADPCRGLEVDTVALDNVFTGWSGEAAVEWPERGRSLTLAMTGPERFLVVYSPPGEAFFCAEPVTNCTNAFNLAAEGRDDTGMIVLAPGASRSIAVRFMGHPGD